MKFQSFCLTLALTMGSAVALAPRLEACLWDYDTLAVELKGIPEVRDVAAGAFDRFPAKYYEMRIERLKKQLGKAEVDADSADSDGDGSANASEVDLEAYDSLAVAYDRLGKSDEAIEWMSKKLAAMEAMGYDSAKEEQPNHRYRYLANLGTFYAHRWVKSGAKQEARDDLDQAIKLIEQAIEENPDAHFGRETYQLKALKWLRDTASKSYTKGGLPDMLGLRAKDAFHDSGDNDTLKKMEIEDAALGLTGLVVQGAAWQSVDVFYALYLTLATDGKHAAALYVFQRVKELVEAGGTSFVKDAPIGAELLKKMEVWSLVDDPHVPDIKADFKAMRTYAKSLDGAREEYMYEKLKAGEHPDTHPEFWAEFEAPARPTLHDEESAGDSPKQTNDDDAPREDSHAKNEESESEDDRNAPGGEGKWGEERQREDQQQPREGKKHAEPRKQNAAPRRNSDG